MSNLLKNILYSKSKVAGQWKPGRSPENNNIATDDSSFKNFILQITSPVSIIDINNKTGISLNGTAFIGEDAAEYSSEGYPLLAHAPALKPEDLGGQIFKNRHNLRYSYIAGAMANGITSTEMVIKMGQSGMIGFFGAGGLKINEIQAAINEIKNADNEIPFGFNLIHSPNDPVLEFNTVKLYLNEQIRLISASAYMDLTLPLVYYRVKGIYRDASGNIICPNKIIAKVSRIEVAWKFFSPPPEKMITDLLNKGLITPEEAELSSQIPVAEDLTAEADSGGHTDNRPAITLLPTMLSLRDEMQKRYGYLNPLCVGLAGGIATPDSTAAAFAMGAAFVLTGSVNQSCVEAGISEVVRKMLCKAQQADVMMAPAADMFELGVKVQVLKRGTMFAMRALKLYDLYTRYNSIDEIPEKQKETLARDYYRCSLDAEWEDTKNFFSEYDPTQIEKAQKNPKHKMALIFRSYLGKSSGWAKSGDISRQLDYQIWCGPAIGAFNEWVKDTYLEPYQNRGVVDIALNLLVGACVVTRGSWLKNQGITLPVGADRFSPVEISKLEELMNS